jgi:hypothetical protein
VNPSTTLLMALQLGYTTQAHHISSCTRIRVRVLSFERDTDLLLLLFFVGVKEILEATWQWRDDLCHLFAFGYYFLRKKS